MDVKLVNTAEPKDKVKRTGKRGCSKHNEVKVDTD